MPSERVPTIEHVVLLCLENRSFDHMLGFLDHPDPSFDGLRGPFPHTNPRSDGEPVAATADGKPFLPYGPDHSHDSVLQQISLTGPADTAEPTHQGFVASYKRTSAGHGPVKTGLLASLLRLFPHRHATPTGARSCGPLVMRCQPSDQVPALSELALAFAVCDNWYCSVPGETWPNRNYLHAATSDGETNIDVRFYENPTVFELLEEHGHDWRIYHDEIPQILAFPKLWDTPERHAKWFGFADFDQHARAGQLPAYCFIEPDHTPPSGLVDVIESRGQNTGRGDSQHPENNLVSEAAYDDYQPGVDTDFARGDRLIASVYESLRANPEAFAKTVLVIIYDEHGGLYDHAPAPQRVVDPGRSPRSWFTRLKQLFLRESAQAFDFTRVGVRVPTVIVSPLIERGVVDHDFLEHASVPATLRAIFAPSANPLTRRDAAAGTFIGLITLASARQDLPDLTALTTLPPRGDPALFVPPAAEDWTPSYYREFLQQSDQAKARLHKLGEPELPQLRQVGNRHDAAVFTAAFSKAAERHRTEVPSAADPP